MAGHYVNRSRIDVMYSETDGWTKTDDVELYLNNWSNASRTAYNNAIENARKSKK